MKCLYCYFYVVPFVEAAHELGHGAVTWFNRMTLLQLINDHKRLPHSWTSCRKRVARWANSLHCHQLARSIRTEQLIFTSTHTQCCRKILHNIKLTMASLPACKCQPNVNCNFTERWGVESGQPAGQNTLGCHHLTPGITTK